MRFHKYTHSENSGKHCFNECVTIVNEEEFSDFSPSVDPVIRMLTIFLNDNLTYHNRQRWLTPFLYRVIGTFQGDLISEKRLRMYKEAVEKIRINDVRFHRIATILKDENRLPIIYPSKFFSQNVKDRHIKPLLGVLDEMIKLTEIKETVPERKEIDYQNIR